jgi:dihydroorotase
MGSFSWDTAGKMMAAGFRPDTISSDVHALCIQGPAWDLLRTMTKFLALGMTLPEVIRAATVAPADAVRRRDLGRLAPGAAGDASVIRLAEIPTELEDVQGNLVPSRTRLVPEGMVIGGQWVETA